MNLKMAHSKSILQELQTHKMRHLNCKPSLNIKTSRVFHFSRCSRQQINKVMQRNSCLRCSNGSCTPRFTSSFDSKGKPWKRNNPHCKRVVESFLTFFLPNQATSLLQNGLSFRLHGNSILDLRKLMEIFPHPVGGCTKVDTLPPARQSAFHSQKEGFVRIVLDNFL